jgi:hypothetical protein
MKTSLIIGTIFFVFLSQRVSLQVLWGGALGITLSVINLFLLSRLSEKLHHKKGLFYVALKFPFFYGLLIFFLYQFHFSAYAFMIGFSIPLFVIILKTFGGFPVVKRATIIRSA